MDGLCSGTIHHSYSLVFLLTPLLASCVDKGQKATKGVLDLSQPLPLILLLPLLSLCLFRRPLRCAQGDGKAENDSQGLQQGRE